MWQIQLTQQFNLFGRLKSQIYICYELVVRYVLMQNFDFNILRCERFLVKPSKCNEVVGCRPITATLVVT